MASRYTVYEYISADTDQSQVSTSQKFIANSVSIYDSSQSTEDFSGASFIEIEDGSIQFENPFTEPAALVLSYTVPSNSVLSDVVSNNKANPNSAFQKYGTATTLKNNNKYSVNIALKGQSKAWSFTTETNPRYSNVEKIRTDTGDLLNFATDEQIDMMLYYNSKELKFILDDQARVSGEISDTNDKLRQQNALKYWVRYKTDMDMVNAIYLSLCGQAGIVFKKIGDIQISKEVQLASIKNMLSRFQQLFEQYDNIINTVEIAPVSFQKASGLATYGNRGTF